MEDIAALQLKFYAAVDELKFLENKIRDQEDTLKKITQQQQDINSEVISLYQKNVVLLEEITKQRQLLDSMEVSIASMKLSSNLYEKKLYAIIPFLIEYQGASHVRRNNEHLEMEHLYNHKFCEPHNADMDLLEREVMTEKTKLNNRLNTLLQTKSEQLAFLKSKYDESELSLEYLLTCIKAFRTKNMALRNAINEKTKINAIQETKNNSESKYTSYNSNKSSFMNDKNPSEYLASTSKKQNNNHPYECSSLIPNDYHSNSIPWYSTKRRKFPSTTSLFDANTSNYENACAKTTSYEIQAQTDNSSGQFRSASQFLVEVEEQVIYASQEVYFDHYE